MSSATRIELQPAWVLHRRAYRESSALLELFTSEFGRVGAVARGVKGRGWSALVEPFVPVRVSWSGRGELKSVVGIEQAGRSYWLTGTPLACGFYMAELIMVFTRRDDPHPRTWQAYSQALDGFAECMHEHEPLLRCFEVVLLEESGYGLLLSEDVHGSELRRQENYWYIPQRGPVPFAAPQPHASAQACPGVGVSGATLLALAAGDEQYLKSNPGRTEARNLMRAVIDQRLDGRLLRSRKMFRSRAAKV